MTPVGLRLAPRRRDRASRRAGSVQTYYRPPAGKQYRQICNCHGSDQPGRARLTASEIGPVRRLGGRPGGPSALPNLPSVGAVFPGTLGDYSGHSQRQCQHSVNFVRREFVVNSFTGAATAFFQRCPANPALPSGVRPADGDRPVGNSRLGRGSAQSCRRAILPVPSPVPAPVRLKWRHG